jgi:hypothetical protein
MEIASQYGSVEVPSLSVNGTHGGQEPGLQRGEAPRQPVNTGDRPTRATSPEPIPPSLPRRKCTTGGFSRIGVVLILPAHYRKQPHGVRLVEEALDLLEGSHVVLRKCQLRADPLVGHPPGHHSDPAIGGTGGLQMARLLHVLLPGGCEPWGGSAVRFALHRQVSNTHRVARVENSSSRSMTAKARSGTNSKMRFWRRKSALMSGEIGWFLAR